VTTAAKTPAEAEQSESPQSENGEVILLDLDELAPKRAEIKRAGKLYKVRTPQEFDIVEEQEFRSELGEYTDLIRKRGLNSKEKAKLRARIDYLFEKVLIADEAERTKFNDRQKQQVVGLFSSALLNEDGAALENSMPAEQKAALQRARELSSITAS